MSTLPKAFISPEKYLELDRAAEYKSEYYDGEMFAMAGAPEGHTLVAANVLASLHAQLRARPCRAYGSDMRVQIRPHGRYAYPDVTVVCGQPEFTDGRRDVLINPTVIVEVLSPSTANFDRGFKFDAYTAIASMREYVLIEPSRVSLDVFTRQPNGRWLLAKALRLEDTIDLESIGCQLALSDVYEKVDFPAAEASA